MLDDTGTVRVYGAYYAVNIDRLYGNCTMKVYAASASAFTVVRSDATKILK